MKKKNDIIGNILLIILEFCSFGIAGLFARNIYDKGFDGFSVVGVVAFVLIGFWLDSLQRD